MHQLTVPRFQGGGQVFGGRCPREGECPVPVQPADPVGEAFVTPFRTRVSRPAVSAAVARRDRY